MECIYDKVWLEILLFKTFSLKNVNLQQLRNIVSSQIIERNSRNVQQLMYASPTNFLLQSVDTTRDAKQGKPFPESLKCIEDKASSSQLKPTSKEDIRFIHLIYIFYLPYRKSRIFFDGYVNYSRIINVIRYEFHENSGVQYFDDENYFAFRLCIGSSKTTHLYYGIFTSHTIV